MARKRNPDKKRERICRRHHVLVRKVSVGKWACVECNMGWQEPQLLSLEDTTTRRIQPTKLTKGQIETLRRAVIYVTRYIEGEESPYYIKSIKFGEGMKAGRFVACSIVKAFRPNENWLTEDRYELHMGIDGGVRKFEQWSKLSGNNINHKRNITCRFYH